MSQSVHFPDTAFSASESSHKKEHRGIPTDKPEFLKPGEKAPGFTLTSHKGRRVTLEEFAGKPVFITFIYTSCKVACSYILQNLGSIEQKVKMETGKDMVTLAVTVDPARDSVATLKGYLKETGISETNLTLLTGTPADVKRVLRSYKIKVARYAETGELAGHPNIGYMIGPDGFINNLLVFDV